MNGRSIVQLWRSATLVMLPGLSPRNGITFLLLRIWKWTTFKCQWLYVGKALRPKTSNTTTLKFFSNDISFEWPRNLKMMLRRFWRCATNFVSVKFFLSSPHELNGGGGGAHGIAAAAAVRTGEGRALRSWDLSREDFLLGWYNITCLCKATKGLGALRAYVGAKFWAGL